MFRGPMYQQGYGLGGYFRRFFKWLVPIAQKHVLPHVKDGLETVGKQVLESGKNFARDAIRGKNVRDAAKDRFDEALEILKDKADKKLSGEGRKKKKRKIIFKKRKYKDIFD